MIKRLLSPFTRPFNRRLDHVEAIVNARSEEVIAAIGAVHAEIQRIADANQALALNVSEIIESHLRIHAESMVALGAVIAELDEQVEAGARTRSNAVSASAE